MEGLTGNFHSQIFRSIMRNYILLSIQQHFAGCKNIYAVIASEIVQKVAQEIPEFSDEDRKEYGDVWSVAMKDNQLTVLFHEALLLYDSV